MIEKGHHWRAAIFIGTRPMRDTIKRYLELANQVVHIQNKEGQSYFPDGELTDDKLQAHLAGKATYALNIVSKDNTTRLVVLDLDYQGNAAVNPDDYLNGLHAAYKGLTDAGITPLISVSGRKGYGLWVVLAEAVPTNTARQFAHALKAKYMADLQYVDLRPDTDKATSAAQAVIKLPPCLHHATGKWSAFIDPTTAADYLNHPWLDNPPDTDAQAALIEQATLTSPAAFFSLLATLNSGLYSAQNNQGRQPLTPEYANAPQGYLSPCIEGLVAHGVPDTLEYNTGNLTLSNYCSSAAISSDRALKLATTMAENSTDHPTGKATVEAKVANFQSNRNSGEAFQCGFMLREDMRPVFGGRVTCNKCLIKPQAMGGNDFTVVPTPQGVTAQPLKATPTPPVTAELEVAMDALAYAWQKGVLIPGVRNVWPLWEVAQGEHLPILALAAGTLPKPSSAEFFRKFELWISANPKYDTPHAHHGAGQFIAALSRRTVSKYAFEGAVARLQEVEKRMALLQATHALTGNARTLSVNKLAADLKGIAEDTLKADQHSGNLASLKGQILDELAADYKAGIATPFSGLNTLLHGGLKGGRLYVLVAPPKAGKTTLVATMMDYAAEQRHPVLYVGYEMARQQMVEYAMARRLEINSRWIETRNLTDDNAKALVHGMAHYLDSVGQYLEVWEAGAKTSIADMAAWVERVKTEHPDKTPLVVVDYLQLANTGDPDIDRHQSDTKRVTGLAVACKDLARKTGAAVMALSSITKSAETEGRNSGDLDETAARDSLAIIHAADGVLTLNVSPKRMETGKGENKDVSYLDQWQVYADQLKVTGSDLGTAVERKAQDLVFDYPPVDLESPAKGIRARLSLKRHRGATGDVALYYQRAYHKFLEVDLLPNKDQKDLYTQDGTSAIQKYAKALSAGTPQNAPEAATAASSDKPKAQITPEPKTPVQAVTGATNTPPYTLYTDLAAAKTALQGFVGRKVGLDLETLGLNPINDQARLLQVSDGHTTAMVDLWKVGGLTALRDELMALDAVAHNAVFDMSFLHHANVPLVLDCTMLAHHVLHGKRESLKTLAQVYLDIELDKTEQLSDWAGELSLDQLEYAARDAVACLAIWGRIDLDSNPNGAYTLVRNAQPAVVQAQLTGIGFDVEGLTTLSDTLQKRKGELEAEVATLMGDINPSSGKQLSQWLVDRLGDKANAWPKTSTGQLKTSADELTAHAHLLAGEDKRVVDLLIELKDVNKKLSSFTGSLAEKVNPLTGRIHATYNLANTVTGRMSCNNPNLQQIPRGAEFRQLFRPEPGRKFVIADFGAIELRVAAVLAGATELIQAFNDGLDPHALTASKLLGVPVESIGKKSPERSMAKAVNFGLLYGQGAKGLQAYAANTFGVAMSIDEAQRYKDGWFKAYPAFGKWQAKVKRDTSRSLITRTPAGRPRQWATDKDYRLTEALNTPVQGGGAEGLLAAMALLVPALAPYDAKLVAVVHDELIVDCAATQADDVSKVLVGCMVKGMCDIFPDMPTTDLAEPMVGDSWAAK